MKRRLTNFFNPLVPFSIMTKKKRFLFRQWFYLRMGYSIYWSFLIMGINTITVTYFLAIERAPFLQAIFPTFLHYALAAVVVVVPLLILTGFTHYKVIPGHKSEMEVHAEANPFVYKLHPGWQLRVMMPYHRLQSEILLKISRGEKITEEEINKMKKIQNGMDTLLKGGYVGEPDRLKKLKSDEE